MGTIEIILHVGTCLLIVAAFVMVGHVLFGIRLAPEPQVNRRIALALGIEDRDTLFETPIVKHALVVGLIAAQRFPLFRDRVRQDLEASGNPNGYSVEEYLALCLLSGVASMVAASLLFAPGFGVWAFAVAGFMLAIGVWAPVLSLSASAGSRTRKIARKLPYTLDLIALMMQAGATFTEASDTGIHDEPEDEFNQELMLVQREIGFGTTRSAALRNMAERIPLESLRSVVGAINQSEALGTPLSTILKNQAAMLRNLRSVAAEEAAAKASLRILLPSMVIMVAVILVIFSPIILALFRGGSVLG